MVYSSDDRIMTKRIIDESDESRKKINKNFLGDEISNFFNEQVWGEDFQDDLKSEVKNSEPYRWGTIKNLIDDSLLRLVRKEVLNEIAFTKKETDIYKVYQSGDLANLSGLDWDDLSRLPSLYKLRAAIYSEQFRDIVSKITGCGKLSGVKTDMSINTYLKGCHLLTHDDVIGSRRVSFILYLPNPDKKWKSHYGGALRLFPAIVPNVPHTDYQVKLVPQFNQIAFFTVQPGLSFHDVEEVRTDKKRLSIQGWFHIPQEGENGYIPGEQEDTEAKSTLQQLQSKELQDYDFPKPLRNDFSFEEISSYASLTELNEDDVEYLSKFLNISYLNKDFLEKVNATFLDESVIELKDILNPKYASNLKGLLEKTELDEEMPIRSKDVKFPWKCAVPPHKQRYMYIDGKSSFDLNKSSIDFVNNIGPQELPNFNLVHGSKTDNALTELASFLKSRSYKKWLTLLTSMIPTSDQVLIRRFRPGSDFILATPTEKNIARNDELNILLEATLNLTPTASDPKNWASGEFGGYELCMGMGGGSSAGEEEDDPAIYKSSDPNDDSILYTSQCSWNSLTLMLKDPSVLKFIKYVSINSKGSRWDVSCQWNIKEANASDNST
ncbi:uncharacterized protein PRCAT00000275001 [Priceomyces carsonii]|uniref:uncharacterized protein n=1 Tax=Priceomyces carsonii TaxID=28549 RepID=UPI002ED7D3A9|nr:unnamed protein product [Priceomyces carsonii]